MIRIKRLLELEEQKRRERQAQLGGCVMPVKMTAFSLAHQQPPQILKTAMISPESNSFSAAEADPFKVVSAKLVPMVLPAGSESSISISAESSDSDLPSRVAAKKKHGIKNDKPEKNENAKNNGSGLATSSQFALNETSLQSQTPLAAGSPVPPPAAASASAITNENANSNSNAVAYKQPPPFVPPDTPSPRLTAKKPTDLKVETAGNNNNLKLPPAVNVQEISPTAQVIKLTSDSNNDPHGAYMMPNRAEFISKLPAEGEKLLCRIVRRREGVEKLYPYYEVFLEDPVHGIVFLMSARKRKKSKSSNYVISLDKIPDSKAKIKALGKVRSNFLGTQFTVYSEGRNPFKQSAKDQLSKPVRSELVTVIYETNLFGLDGPRKMTAILPAIRDKDERAEIKPTREKDTIMEKYKSGVFTDLILIRNKSPQWNDETQSYVLNFHGRVTKASVKNFQLIDEKNADYIIMQFGRIGDNSFTMDVQRPMSIIQAFGIVLSSFDAKLACE